MIIEVNCETCAGTGNMTPGGGRNNLKDRCTTCGEKGKIPARTGETPESSWPLAVPGAAAQKVPGVGDRATVLILYTNWQGETRPRRIRLDFNAHGNEVLGLGFGSNQWHPQPQLLLNAFDIEKGGYRTFAMAGVKAWGEQNVQAEVERMNRATASITRPTSLQQAAQDAMEFYADPRNWIDTPSWDGDPGCITPAAIPVLDDGDGSHPCDCGDTARKALRSIQLSQARDQAWSPETSAAWRDVMAERLRQVEAEGWTHEHDDTHAGGELANAAAAYAVTGGGFLDFDGEKSAGWVSYADALWPFEGRPKRTSRREDVVKATALGLAEIERQDRAAAKCSSADASKEEPTICVCGEPIRDGDKVYTCQSSGVVHAECMGTDPENFPGPDGEPRKPGDPIPAPWVYSTGEAGR